MRRLPVVLASLVALAVAAPALGSGSVTLEPVGTYRLPGDTFDEGAAEIVAFDKETKRAFVVNGLDETIDVLSIAGPTNPSFLFAIPIVSGSPNSVDVYGKLVAAAVESDPPTDSGRVDLFTTDGTFLRSIVVGALPDMVTFTPNGRYLLTADEGQPEDGVDPPGSVSVIDLRRGVAKATVRTVPFGQSQEPEYIAVSKDGKRAWVTIQEANQIAEIDVVGASLVAVRDLGTKDHSLPENALDGSDRDGKVNIATWPVRGLYQPDGIAAFERGGQICLVSANEGDVGEGVQDERVKDLVLDPVAFPDAATLQADAAIGRLIVDAGLGQGPNGYTELYAFGARSFSIWKADGTQAFDSGDDLEQVTAASFGGCFLVPVSTTCFFNASNSNNTFDNRSPSKGPEPEGVTTGDVGGRTLAFVGLERVGGVAVYDVSASTAPVFQTYVNNRDFTAAVTTAAAKDLGPEGLEFVPSWQSPNGKALLLVANEVSGTVTVWQIGVGIAQ